MAENERNRLICAHFLAEKFVAADYQGFATEIATNFLPLFQSYALIFRHLQPSRLKSTENFYYSIYIFMYVYLQILLGLLSKNDFLCSWLQIIKNQAVTMQQRMQQRNTAVATY